MASNLEYAKLSAYVYSDGGPTRPPLPQNWVPALGADGFPFILGAERILRGRISQCGDG